MPIRQRLTSTVRIVVTNPVSGLMLDVQGDSYWGGAEIDTWYPNGQVNQVFGFSVCNRDGARRRIRVKNPPAGQVLSESLGFQARQSANQGAVKRGDCGLSPNEIE